MQYLKADTVTEVLIGPVVAVGDGFTPVTTLSIATADEAEIIKHGATTVTAITGTLAAITSADGYYALDLVAGDVDTEGRLTVLINDDSLCLPVRHDFMVVNANIFDSLFAAATTDYLQVDTSQWLGTACATPTVAGVPEVDLTHVAGTTTNVAALATNVDAILTDTAVIGTPAGASIAADLLAIDNFVDDLEGRLTATRAGYLDNLSAGAAALEATLTDMKGATFAGATDSLEAIRDRGDAAWTTGAGGSDRLLMVDTTIATLATQVSFTLTAGSADNDAYNNCTIIIEDVSTATQKAVGMVLDYVGATKTITLKEALAFTIATTDKVYILAENSLKSTVANRQIDVTATGAAGIDWGNVENPTTAVDLSATDIQLCDTTTTNTDMRGTNSAALASVCTETRLAELDAANLPATTDAILVDTAVIGAAGAGLTAVPWNAAWDAEVQSECADALNAYDPPTNTEMVAAFTEIKGATWAATDTLEAIRDRGDAAWITATGFSTHAAADVWAVGIKALTDKAGFSLAADQAVNATKINGSATAAVKLALSAATIVNGVAAVGTLTVTQMTTNLTEATNDHYKGRVIIWTSGALTDEATDITAYDGATKKLTFTATTEAPAAGDSFIVV